MQTKLSKRSSLAALMWFYFTKTDIKATFLSIARLRAICLTVSCPMDNPHNPHNMNPRGPESEIVWARATQWISRTLAVVVIMVAPGVIGAMLDKRLETGFLALLGFAFGLVLGTIGLLVLAKRFTPPAGGKPLPWDDEIPAETEEEPCKSDSHQ